MKRLILALLLSAFLFASLCYLAQAGPESLPPIPDAKDKIMMEPPKPDYDFFREHEWDLSMWGTWVFSAHPGRNHVPNDDPFVPDLDPEILVSTFFATTIKEPETLNPDEHLDVGRRNKDTFLGRDDSWGGGVDLKYFWSRYFGVGLEGFLVDTETQLGGAGLVTLTARYPMGCFAPYIFAGAGVLAGGGRTDYFFNETHTYAGGFVTSEREFFTTEKINNDDVFFDGQIGAGIEVRFNRHLGMMVDFAWNFVAPDESDGHRLVVSPGGTNFTVGPPPITFPNNTAVATVPGANAGNKQFGMVRFGLTIAY